MATPRTEQFVGFEYSVGHLDGTLCILRRGGWIPIRHSINASPWQRYLVAATGCGRADEIDIRQIVEMLNKQSEEDMADQAPTEEEPE